MNRNFKIGLFSILVIIIIAFALKGRITHVEFSSDKWKNWKESEAEWSLRWDMMNSLRNNYELQGMSKDEIIELLGEPESQTQTEFLYYLGMAKKGIDTGTLTIKFNETGKVAYYNVRNG